MKLPIRFRVRTLLVTVALVALTLGSAIGWVNHVESDSQLELDARLFRQIAWHLRQANICRAAEAGGLPYPKPDRIRLFGENISIYRTLNYTVPTGWPAEARLHDDWASAMQDRAGNLYDKGFGRW